MIDEYERVVRMVSAEGIQIVGQDIERLRGEVPAILESLQAEENRERLTNDFDRDQRIFDLTSAQLRQRQDEITLWRKELEDSDLSKEARDAVRLAILDRHEKLLRDTRNLAGTLVGVRAEMIRVRPTP